MKIKKTGHAGKSGFHKEWIYGLNPVREAVRAGRDIKLIIISTSRKGKNSGFEKELSSSGIKIKIEDSLFFDKRFPKGHQGIAAAVIPRKYTDFEELLNIPAKKGEVPVFLILDCLEDPRNFGAILRVADAGGIHGVVIQSRRSATLVPEAVKASAGASEYVPIAMVPNIKHAIQHMKDIGLTIIGAEAGEGKTIWELNLNVPLAIVTGSEGKGLRRTVKECCDILISLPMKGRINTLNASVAAGVIVFEIMRQRMSNFKK